MAELLLILVVLGGIIAVIFFILRSEKVKSKKLALGIFLLILGGLSLFINRTQSTRLEYENRRGDIPERVQRGAKNFNAIFEVAGWGLGGLGLVVLLAGLLQKTPDKSE